MYSVEVDLGKKELKMLELVSAFEEEEKVTYQCSESETEDFSNFSLTRDRAKREIRHVQRYGHTDLISYAFYVGEKVELSELRNYKEVL